MNLYLILVMRNPTFNPALIGAHLRFLDELRAQERVELSGAFSDQSGGAWLLRAASLAEATVIAERDPLHLQGASTITIHEWNAK
ncbi:MAG: YciI family protein [Dokdonella sp.]